jgi:cell division protein FtsN
VQRLRGTWNADLPVIAADGTLLIREGNAVVAYDPETGAEAGRIADAPLGRWVTIPWDPQPPALQMAAQSTEPRVARSEGLIYYAQVSSTSNQAWAEDLAQRLRAGSVEATVLLPTSIEDRYRVVLGPFGSREQADDMGRRLGRAYFVFSQEDTTTTR